MIPTNRPANRQSWFIDTAVELKFFVDRIYELPADGNTLFMDLEGVNLGRTGTISICQVYINSVKELYFVDVTTLGDKAFKILGAKSQKTFKNILEDETIMKVFFALNNDSANLYWKHDIRMKGAMDAQIAKGGMKSYIDCVANDCGLTAAEAAAMAVIKAEGKALYAPSKGKKGPPPNFKIFNKASTPGSTCPSKH